MQIMWELHAIYFPPQPDDYIPFLIESSPCLCYVMRMIEKRSHSVLLFIKGISELNCFARELISYRINVAHFTTKEKCLTTLSLDIAYVIC